MAWPLVSRTGDQNGAGADRPRASPRMSTCNGTTFGLVDGRPVFMDLGDDSYFMLEPGEETAFRASFGKLLPAGEFGTADGPPVGPVQCPRPSSSVLTMRQYRSRGRPCDAFRVCRLLLDIRSALRRRPIAAVLSGGVSRPFRSTEAPVAGSAQMLASRFARARWLVPLSGNCLTDSLALVRWLQEHGAGATLIFGVKLDPFAAHCWVQTNEILLNDLAERVERFTPVRAIECTRPTP